MSGISQRCKYLETLFSVRVLPVAARKSVADDPEQQFRDAFQMLGETLAAANMSFKNIVEMTTHHVDLRRHLLAFVRAKNEHMLAPFPAWSAIETAELITEDTLVGIRVISQLNKDK